MDEMVGLHGSVQDGLIPAEKVVYIEDADGSREEITVSVGNVINNKLMVCLVGKKDDRLLVELPRESASGRWRMWVKAATVGGGLDDKERVEKILGKEFSTIFFNECSQIGYASVTTALTRAKAPQGVGMWVKAATVGM